MSQAEVLPWILLMGCSSGSRPKAVVRSRKIAEEIELYAKQIAMLSGKPNAKTKRKALYAKMFTRVARLVRIFTPILNMAIKIIEKVPLPPSKAKRVQTLLTECLEDLKSIEKISAYSRKRIFRDEQTPGQEKVCSVSDPDAAIIKKGGREDEFGYKPQLAFSGQGLLTAQILPVGNAADSGQLLNILEANERNTGVVPKRVTLDDGYTNSGVRNEYMERHEGKIEVFSFSGSKGRRAIPKELYDSEEYKKARADRSAAESRIFTIKFNHGYEEVTRRGQKNVEHEQRTKGLAYNIRRIVWLKKARARAEREAALKKAA